MQTYLPQSHEFLEEAEQLGIHKGSYNYIAYLLLWITNGRANHERASCSLRRIWSLPPEKSRLCSRRGRVADPSSSAALRLCSAMLLLDLQREEAGSSPRRRLGAGPRACACRCRRSSMNVGRPRPDPPREKPGRAHRRRSAAFGEGAITAGAPPTPIATWRHRRRLSLAAWSGEGGGRRRGGEQGERGRHGRRGEWD
jgi:hypothetical protein